jgi:F-type H+-transporting ATPase subunit b
MLELNSTIVLQIIAYFLLLYLLNRLLYRPVLRVMDERRKRTEGTLRDAADIEKEVEEGLGAYKKRIKEETVRAQEARAAIKKEAHEKEKEILDRARMEAQKEISRIKEELEKSKATALETLKREARRLSTTIAEKVLERGLTSVLIVLTLPAIALGATGGEEGPAGTIWKIINFIILAAVLYFVWIKWIRGFLEGRSTDIQKAIAAAEKTRAEAEAKFNEYKQKLTLLDKKIEQIHDELMLEAGEEKKRILEEAEDASSKIRGQARLSAEQEIKKAKIELQKEVARLAVNPEDHKRLVKDYIGKLSVS